MANAPSHAPQLTHDYIFFRHNQPNLIRTDQIANTIEDLLWKRASLKFHGSYDATFQAVTATSYAPDELPALATCLGVRNELAAVCGVQEQRTPFRGKLGYTLDGAAPPQLLNRIDMTRLLVGGLVPHAIGKAYSQDELEHYYVPFLYHLDALISNLERVIYEHEWGKWCNDRKINQVIRDPSYAAPDALHRNALLQTRNEWAKKLGLPPRTSHDFLPYKEASWQLRIDGEELPDYVLDALSPNRFQVSP